MHVIYMSYSDRYRNVTGSLVIQMLIYHVNVQKEFTLKIQKIMTKTPYEKMHNFGGILNRKN